jgi:hypothetical protein
MMFPLVPVQLTQHESHTGRENQPFKVAAIFLKTLVTADAIPGLPPMTAIAINTNMTAYSTVVTPFSFLSFFNICVTSMLAILDRVRRFANGSKVLWE